MAEAPKQQPSYVGNPTSIPGKMITTEWPTPGLDDRIVKLRKDFRKFSKLPRRGSKYSGPNAEKFCDFRFATAKATDQIGWVDLYYVNERKNQDEYNFEISYPYTDKNYPTVTRTYVVLRGDQRSKEPDADSKDPVYGDLSLTDHKVIRLQQNELDALFVGIQRVYERLPSPVIFSAQLNQYQQEVVVAEQEDINPEFPTVSAVTESAKVERKTTAKAKSTLANTESVFPDTNYKVSRDDAVVPYRHRKFLAALPSVQVSGVLAGNASLPTLANVDWDASDHQITKYKHQISRTVRNLTAPIALLEYRITNDQQVSTTTETWARGMQSLIPTTLIIEGDVIQLGNHESIKSVTTIPDVFSQSVYEAEISDPVPPKFRVVVPVVSSSQTSEGRAVPPVLGTGELQRRDEQTKVFWHRLTIKGRDVTQLPVSLVSYELTPELQIGQVKETLARGLQTLSPNERTIKGSVDNLGNATSLKSVTTVPNVFGRREYTTNVPDTLPERFRVKVPTLEVAATIPGQAIQQLTLGTGELEVKDQQEKEFTHRVTIRGRDIAHLPVSLINYELTPEQQIGRVTDTLATGLQTLSPNERLIKGSVEDLGNQTSLKSTTTVPNVFSQVVYESEIPDPVPQKFKVAIPVGTLTQTTAGTAVPPVLGTGELQRRDEQTKQFWHRQTIKYRDPSHLPTSLVSYELTPDQQIGRVTETLATGLQTLSPNERLIKGSVDNLGNNTSLKSATTVPNVFSQAIYETEIPDPVPQKFKVAIPVNTFIQTTAGTASPPVLGTGELQRKDEQIKEFWHRRTVRNRDVTQLPRSLVSYELTPEQQVGTVTETLAAGLQSLSPNELLIKGSVEDLGNQTSLKSTTSVPVVFSKQEYRTTIPDSLPERFRVAIPTYEVSQTIHGQASATPHLGTGELERQDIQETDFKHRTSVKSRSVAAGVVLVSYKLTKDKQVETLLETFASGIQTISPNALTIEADVTNLGNNTSIQSVGTVDQLFTEPSFEVTIPDLVPPEFKANAPTTITESLIGGLAGIPTLGTGDISRSQRQVNQFVYRDRLETRAGIALPKQFINKELTREFGGGDTDIIRTLDLVGAPTVTDLDEGLIVLKSEIRDLGNGMALKETQQLRGVAWPPVPSSLWDDNMRVQYAETKQTVDAGTGPVLDPGGDTFAWISEVKGIDKWKSALINTNKPAPIYTSPETALITREFRPYRFPGYLNFAGNGYYTRGATAVLVEHVIRTWWVKSVETPEIVYDKIVTGDVIINNLSLTGLEYARNVLHDGFSFGTLSFPATTPTATDYSLGRSSGSTLQNFAGVLFTNRGTGYHAGDNLLISDGTHSMHVSVDTVVDFPGQAGAIGTTTSVGGDFPTGFYGPLPGVGGAGSGALFSVGAANLPTYVPGTAWIGTYKIIDASVVPEKEPNIWKCQTKSVIME